MCLLHTRVTFMAHIPKEKLPTLFEKNFLSWRKKSQNGKREKVIEEEGVSMTQKGLWNLGCVVLRVVPGIFYYPKNFFWQPVSLSTQTFLLTFSHVTLVSTLGFFTFTLNYWTDKFIQIHISNKSWRRKMRNGKMFGELLIGSKVLWWSSYSFR